MSMALLKNLSISSKLSYLLASTYLKHLLLFPHLYRQELNFPSLISWKPDNPYESTFPRHHVNKQSRTVVPERQGIKEASPTPTSLLQGGISRTQHSRERHHSWWLCRFEQKASGIWADGEAGIFRAEKPQEVGSSWELESRPRAAVLPRVWVQAHDLAQARAIQLVRVMCNYCKNVSNILK